jgi:hypothetical protein
MAGTDALKTPMQQKRCLISKRSERGSVGRNLLYQTPGNFCDWISQVLIIQNTLNIFACNVFSDFFE